MSSRIAYISSGKLHVLAGGKSRQIDSEFGRAVTERALRSKQKHDWKMRGREGSPFSGGMLWGVNPQDPDAIPLNITSVSPGGVQGSLLYVLETDAIGGLFSYHESDGEQRVFHKENFRGRDLRLAGDRSKLCLAILHSNGMSHIAVADSDGRNMEEITEGDSIDAAPAWAGDSTILFQSAGMMRDGAGYPVGLGPFSIEELDLGSGRMETILSDPAFDFLQPRKADDGALWFIRRPYEKHGPSSSPFRTLQDVILFPFRLFSAIVHFLNAFSLFFSKKPLMGEGPHNTKSIDSTRMMLWGRTLDIEAAARKGATGEKASLVPDWKLIRRTAAGEETVIGTGVAAFDIAPNGDVTYTDGMSIFLLPAGGQRQKLFASRLVSSVQFV